MPENNYSGFSQFLGQKSVPVVVADEAVLACSGLYVTGGGVLKVEYEDSTTDTITVPSFFFWPLAVKRVLDDGVTTATGIKAIY